VTSVEKFQQSVFACKDITEIDAVQSALLTATIRDYAHDTREVTQTMQALMIQRTAVTRQ